jgi:hypothetical protein
MGKKIGRREFIKKSTRYSLAAAVGGSALNHFVQAPSAYASLRARG